MVMVNKVVKLLDKLLDTVVVIVCILLLLIGLWSVMDNIWLFNNAQDKSVLRYKPPAGQTLDPEQKISKNHIAWLTVDDTSIDYPVMQGKDNYEYLNKDPYGDFSLGGSIFLDANNDPELTDPYSLIYGHHMSRGVMFGALDAFKDEAYFAAHRTGSVSTPTHVYKLRTFAVAPADGTDNVVFNVLNHRSTADILVFLEKNAMIYEELGEQDKDLRILALSTCTSAATTERLVVFCTIQDQEIPDQQVQDQE